jgi:N-dimethylarginine dimethylaminohydrolase
MTDIGPWSHIIVGHPRRTFESDTKIAREWRELNFTAPPDFMQACEQFDAFVEMITSAGAPAHLSTTAPAHPPTRASAHLTLDAIYVRDASVMCDRGAILCRMGKPQREAEPAAVADTYAALGIPVIGRIEAPGTLEGGDVTWLGPRLAAVGRGYRTNDAGIRQLRSLLGDSVDELIEVPLPHYRGPSDVFHLMSFISPVDRDLAVVYSPLMPIPFRERLLDLGYTLVEVPDEEFDSVGANVFAAAPRHCVMVDGNPVTRAGLERAGADVRVYDGSEISLKGGGGPTCLTRPVRMGGWADGRMGGWADGEISDD